MKFLLLIFLVLGMYGTGFCQQITVIKIADLENRISNGSDTTYIVNFWATWCVPCVKELPDFDSIHTSCAGHKVKVLLVSLDFKEDLESKLRPFMAKRKIKSEVLLLDEVNANYFIPKVSKEWTGAIPATLIRNDQKKVNVFFENKLDYDFLKKEIEKVE